jgi:metal-responsive CopG/Arc/MetJ family transcriptional regulator
MKTALSLPDDLFREAERYAKKHGVTRSQLYAKAIRNLLKQRNADAITEAINKVLETTANDIDPAVVQAQLRAVGREDW